MIKVMDNGSSAREMAHLSTRDINVHELTACSSAQEMGHSDHFVQFYDTDAFLLNSVSDFVSKGLGAGEGCIIVATKAHRDDIERQLQAQGVNLADSGARGQYVSLDAAETLSRFMHDGQPEPGRFKEVLKGVLNGASTGRPRIRIFGEMVALLWAEGNRDGAIRLEELWNELQQEHSFSLFCAYPMNGFDGEEFIEPLGKVCTTHSHVIPAESYSALTSVDERLRAIIQLQQKAGRLEAEIAERRQVEERLRLSLIQEQLARAEAENANRLKDEFLATVSHELRTPLTAILGWSHMLRNGKLDEATLKRAVDTIERNAQSQAQLVEDILDVSRVITGKLRLNIATVDVASVINAAIDSVQLAADAKEIKLEVTLDPSARRVYGDASRLQQVTWNLLSNAIKFTPVGGRVAVRLERAGTDIQLSVSDTGCGIKPDFLPFIFDRFRQADGTSTRSHGGLGLGLAIVRHLVELHGGTIAADSPGAGLGATFTIKLPGSSSLEHPKVRTHDEQDRLGQESSEHLRPLPALDGVRVLLVDDDPDTLQILSVMLTEYKATVQSVATASAALEVLSWYQPDVLVSDLAMPCEDGYSLISQIRKREAECGQQQHIPAVALTAYVRVEDRTRALSSGFNMFVPKPVEPSELITTIANLTEDRANDPGRT